MQQPHQTLKINIPGFTNEDLFKPDRLEELTSRFYNYVEDADPDVWKSFNAYRISAGAGFSDIQVSDILVRTAPYLSSFVESMFDISDDYRRLRTVTLRDQ
ncbi:MAG TPA: hypothetical protein VI758_02060, partial [Bacteroidota bacterium]